MSSRDLPAISPTERCTVLSSPVCEGAERSLSVAWIRPDVTVEVQYNELMQGRLRDPVYRGLVLLGD